MKTKLLYLALLSFIFLLPKTGYAQKKRAEKAAVIAAEFQKTATLVESNRFVMEIDRVYASRGYDLSRFNPRGKITISHDSVEGHLPFFGRAYQLPYGESGGIEFNAPMKDKKVEIKEKRNLKTIHYGFSVQGRGDVYRVQLEISSNGNSTLYVTSHNREQISYSGKIFAPEEK